MKNQLPNSRVIAFYLPQFHPIPENDEWWGKGFTDWTNVAKARPLFQGHYQPRVPSDLGFYDLRLPEVRQAQADLARDHGIEGFAYWHYWFAGRRILERPFNEVLSSGKPDFPFCLAWANESWSGLWHGDPGRILLEQTYPGVSDHVRHFRSLIPAFRDPRYMRINGRPIFLVYRPHKLPEAKVFVQTWREESAKEGLEEPYFIGILNGGGAWNHLEHGFDGVVVSNQARASTFGFRSALRDLGRNSVSGLGSLPPENALRWLLKGLRFDVGRTLRTLTGGVRHRYSYRSVVPLFLERPRNGRTWFPCVVPDWDNSPRSGKRAVVLVGSNPEVFGETVRDAVGSLQDRPREERIIFVKSWNEWAEGNYLEPDHRYRRGYLEAIRQEVIADQAVI